MIQSSPLGGFFMENFYIDKNRERIINNRNAFLDGNYALQNPNDFWKLGCLDFLKYYFFYDEWRINDSLNHIYAFIKSFSSMEEMIEVLRENPKAAFCVQNDLFRAEEPFLLDELVEAFLTAIEHFAMEPLIQKMTLVNSIPTELIEDTMKRNSDYLDDIWNYVAPAKHWLECLKTILFQYQNYNQTALYFESFLLQCNSPEILESVYDNIFLASSIRLNERDSLMPSRRKILELAKEINKKSLAK